MLLEIDPIDCRRAVSEAERALELELARLGLNDLPGPDFDLHRLPSVERAATLERNAATRRDRSMRLGNASALEDKEQAEADYELGRANSRQAVLDAAAVLASTRQRKAALQTAPQRLKETKIYAPPLPVEAGTSAAVPPDYAICQRSVSAREMVWSMPAFPDMAGTSSTLFKLIVDRSLKLQAAIPDRHRSEIRIGQEVILDVESYPGEQFSGKVVRVNASIDRASRTFQVEIHVDNFACMYAMGISINNFTMIGLILAVGIAVDDAVVVHENIFRHMEEFGRGAAEAVASATGEIAPAVVATTMSLVVVFAPIALMGGQVGRFLSCFGYVVGFSVLISMFVSFTMTPMLCGRFLTLEHGTSSKGGIVWRALEGGYAALLAWSLQHRWVMVLAALAVFAMKCSACLWLA